MEKTQVYVFPALNLTPLMTFSCKESMAAEKANKGGTHRRPQRKIEAAEYKIRKGCYGRAGTEKKTRDGGGGINHE
jgi:hypothetical protein